MEDSLWSEYDFRQKNRMGQTVVLKLEKLVSTVKFFILNEKIHNQVVRGLDYQVGCLRFESCLVTLPMISTICLSVCLFPNSSKMHPPPNSGQDSY